MAFIYVSTDHQNMWISHLNGVRRAFLIGPITRSAANAGEEVTPMLSVGTMRPGMRARAIADGRWPIVVDRRG